MKPICIVQNWAPESPGNIADYLKSEQIEFMTVRAYENEPLPEIKSIEAAIILGTPISIRTYREHDFLKQLYAFTAKAIRADLPCLGICGGSQMMARVLGAEVRRNPVKEIGVFKVRLTESGRSDRLFNSFDNDFEVFQWHGDTFDIPHGAERLAESDDCANQAFRKGNAVGIQFHVEPTIDEIPLWCDDYIDELTAEGLTKEKIVTDYNRSAEQLRQASNRLIKNFLG